MHISKLSHLGLLVSAIAILVATVAQAAPAPVNTNFRKSTGSTSPTSNDDLLAATDIPVSPVSSLSSTNSTTRFSVSPSSSTASTPAGRRRSTSSTGLEGESDAEEGTPPSFPLPPSPPVRPSALARPNLNPIRTGPSTATGGAGGGGGGGLSAPSTGRVSEFRSRAGSLSLTPLSIDTGGGGSTLTAGGGSGFGRNKVGISPKPVFGTGSNRFRLDARIASGAQSTAFHATKLSNNEAVVVKFTNSATRTKLVFVKDFEKDVEHEAKMNALVGLSAGELVFDKINEELMTAYIPMKLVAGKPLATILGDVEFKGSRRAAIKAAADALRRVFAQGILFNDAHANNFLIQLGEEDRVISATLIDYGAATLKSEGVHEGDMRFVSESSDISKFDIIVKKALSRLVKSRELDAHHRQEIQELLKEENMFSLK